MPLVLRRPFGTHWLFIRACHELGVAANPGVTINLATRTTPFDFAHERFHAAIHFGRDWLARGPELR